MHRYTRILIVLIGLSTMTIPCFLGFLSWEFLSVFVGVGLVIVGLLCVIWSLRSPASLPQHVIPQQVNPSMPQHVVSNVPQVQSQQDSASIQLQLSEDDYGLIASKSSPQVSHKPVSKPHRQPNPEDSLSGCQSFFEHQQGSVQSHKNSGDFRTFSLLNRPLKPHHYTDTSEPIANSIEGFNHVVEHQMVVQKVPVVPLFQNVGDAPKKEEEFHTLDVPSEQLHAISQDLSIPSGDLSLLSGDLDLPLEEELDDEHTSSTQSDLECTQVGFHLSELENSCSERTVVSNASLGYARQLQGLLRERGVLCADDSLPLENEMKTEHIHLDTEDLEELKIP